MNIKRRIVITYFSALTKIFNIFGVRSYFGLKSETDLIAFDRLNLLSYFQRDQRTQLYLEGQERSKMGYADNFQKQRRFYSMLQVLEYTRKQGVVGDLAECGCWKGHSAFMICKTAKAYGFYGELHVFDSFEGGLSDKTVEDKNSRIQESEKMRLAEKNVFKSTEDDLRNAVSDYNFVKVYKGWIPERFSEVGSKTFSFVHVDVDLYQPTLDSLRFFWARLSKNGAICIDDYGYTRFPGATKAVQELLKEVNDCAFIMKCPWVPVS